MKMTITTEDVDFLTGKFILQVTSNKPNFVVNEDSWSFIMEKRISFVCGLRWMGFFYEHKAFENKEQFVAYFNDYVFLDSKSDPERSKGERFHRLLTSAEIEFVCKKMKERNY